MHGKKNLEISLELVGKGMTPERQRSLTLCSNNFLFSNHCIQLYKATMSLIFTQRLKILKTHPSALHSPLSP